MFDGISILIIFVLFIGIVIVMGKVAKPKPSQKEFYEQQSKAIAVGGGYYARSLLNKSEVEAHKAILRYIYSNPVLKGRLKVFSQVCIGEFIGNDDRTLFDAINYKRVDFLITDSSYRPLVVLEMNGTGHRLSETADLRDSIKKQAIENAGIAFYPIEISKFSEAYQVTFQIMEKHTWA